MKICRTSKGVYTFFCPGCQHHHIYWTAEYPRTPEDQPPVWTFNGDWERPTFRASLLNTWGTYADPNWKCAGDTPEEIADLTRRFSGRCHLFISAGIIEFCGDCTHALNGQHVPMVEVSDYYKERYKDINP
jgi:hypothetical protein